MPDPLRPSQVIYREEQQFRQIWLWALLLGGLAVALAASMPLLIKLQHRGLPASFWLSIAFPIAFMFLVNALFYYTRLVTEIRTDGISVCFRPFQPTPLVHAYAEIERCETVSYRPIADYGGWGIKRDRTGLAYNVSGNKGLLLTLKSGKTFLIGSQQPERLKAAMDSAMMRK